MKTFIAYTKEKGKIETDNSDDFNGLTWHRLDGPAFQRFYDNGPIWVETYYINGKKHREDGPAVQGFYDNGQLFHEAYFINDKEYTKSEYETEIFKMKLALL